MSGQKRTKWSYSVIGIITGTLVLMNNCGGPFTSLNSGSHLPYEDAQLTRLHERDIDVLNSGKTTTADSDGGIRRCYWSPRGECSSEITPPICNREGECGIIRSKYDFYFHFSYGPTITSHEGRYHMFFCSAGNKQSWDLVRYSTSEDGKNWSEPVVVVRSSDATNERTACDPSLVYFNAGDGDYFYLFYSANAIHAATVNMVARSKNIEGPYQKYTERGTWEISPPDPKIINIARHYQPDGPGQPYGAGQPTVVNLNGMLHMWYTDTTINLPFASQNLIVYTRSTDGIHWSTPVVTNINASSIDVAYSKDSQKFVSFDMEAGHTPISRIIIRTSKDGLVWSNPQVLADTDEVLSYSHNIGISRTISGELFDNVLVGYGGPRNFATSDAWGAWDMYLRSFAAPGSQTKHSLQALDHTMTMPDLLICKSAATMITLHLFNRGREGNFAYGHAGINVRVRPSGEIFAIHDPENRLAQSNCHTGMSIHDIEQSYREASTSGVQPGWPDEIKCGSNHFFERLRLQNAGMNNGVSYGTSDTHVTFHRDTQTIRTVSGGTLALKESNCQPGVHVSQISQKNWQKSYLDQNSTNLPEILSCYTENREHWTYLPLEEVNEKTAIYATGLQRVIVDVYSRDILRQENPFLALQHSECQPGRSLLGLEKILSH